MAEEQADLITDPRHERASRIRIGATGLAAIVVIVLLAASFSGTASNEPELTPEAMAEQALTDGDPTPAEEMPQEPLAELGVAPGTGPIEDPVTEPEPNLDPADSPES